MAVASDVGRERTRIPVSGPSFLGLGDERSRDLDYLLEDEPPRGHGRLYLALLLLVASGALLAWHWQRDGYPWSGLFLKPTISNRQPASSPQVTAPDSAAAAVPNVPVEPTANPAPPEAQPATSEAGQPPAVGPAGMGAPANPSAAAKPGDQTSQPQVSQPEVLPPQVSLPQVPQPRARPDSAEAAKTPTSAPTQANGPEPAEPAPAEPGPKEMRAATAAPPPRAVNRKPLPAAPPDSFEDRLVSDGERYLYGRGVPQDCERAQRNLQIGARQSNAKAQTLLGAMYATGHCVSRDLPTAYRWFAKALRGDPGNSRVQRDLEVLWKQMTPEERQLATRSQ
jgi:hypothetical protein